MGMMKQARRQVKSYKYAAKGVRYTLATQVNIWLHLMIAGAVSLLAYFLHFSLEQYLLVLLAIGFVIAAELFNTALEEMTNLLSPEYHEVAGVVKDVAAGAVLVAALTAGVVGVVLFGPPLFELVFG